MSPTAQAIITGLLIGAAPTTLLALTLLWLQRRAADKPAPTNVVRIDLPRCKGPYGPARTDPAPR